MKNVAWKEMSREDVWRRLREASLVEGDMPPASEQHTPWFVRVMLGAAGWIGALFLFGFVGVAFSEQHEQQRHGDARKQHRAEQRRLAAVAPGHIEAAQHRQQEAQRHQREEGLHGHEIPPGLWPGAPGVRR